MARTVSKGKIVCEPSEVMEPTVQHAKAALRRQIRDVLSEMKNSSRAEASAKACSLLASQSIWKSADSVLFYAPLPEELNVWPLVEVALGAGKVVALPRFNPETQRYTACRVSDLGGEVLSGQFGIREPSAHCQEVSLNRLDLILVPGVAFDALGHRLGRGKGYYDRFLSVATGTRCGVAFDEQIVSEVPLAPHDVHLNCILTPTRWISL